MGGAWGGGLTPRPRWALFLGSLEKTSNSIFFLCEALAYVTLTLVFASKNSPAGAPLARRGVWAGLWVARRRWRRLCSGGRRIHR